DVSARGARGDLDDRAHGEAEPLGQREREVVEARERVDGRDDDGSGGAEAEFAPLPRGEFGGDVQVVGRGRQATGFAEVLDSADRCGEVVGTAVGEGRPVPPSPPLPRRGIGGGEHSPRARASFDADGEVAVDGEEDGGIAGIHDGVFPGDEEFARCPAGDHRYSPAVAGSATRCAPGPEPTALTLSAPAVAASSAARRSPSAGCTRTATFGPASAVEYASRPRVRKWATASKISTDRGSR